MKLRDANSAEPIISPFTVGVEHREHLPFTFVGMRADAKDGNRPLTVRTQRGHAKSGDYWIIPDPDCPLNLDLSGIAIERKAEDLPNSLTWRRKPFEGELERLNDECEFAAVVCEHSLLQLVHEQIGGSRANPRSMIGSIVALSQRYVRVHWFFAGSRRLAEGLTYRLLERFYRDKLKAAQEAIK